MGLSAAVVTADPTIGRAQHHTPRFRRAQTNMTPLQQSVGMARTIEAEAFRMAQVVPPSLHLGNLARCLVSARIFSSVLV